MACSPDDPAFHEQNLLHPWFKQQDSTGRSRRVLMKKTHIS